MKRMHIHFGVGHLNEHTREISAVKAGYLGKKSNGCCG